MTRNEEQFGDNHKVKLGRKRSKTCGVKLGKMASGFVGALGAISLGALAWLVWGPHGCPQVLPTKCSPLYSQKAGAL